MNENTEYTDPELNELVNLQATLHQHSYNVPPPAGYVEPVGFPNHNFEYKLQYEKLMNEYTPHGGWYAAIPLKVVTIHAYILYLFGTFEPTKKGALNDIVIPILELVESFGRDGDRYGQLACGGAEVLNLLKNTGLACNSEYKELWNYILTYIGNKEKCFENIAKNPLKFLENSKAEIQLIETSYDKFIKLLPDNILYFSHLKEKYVAEKRNNITTQKRLNTYTGAPIVEIKTNVEIGAFCRIMTEKLLQDFDFEKASKEFPIDKTIWKIASEKARLGEASETLDSTHKDSIARLNRWVERWEIFFNTVAPQLALPAANPGVNAPATATKSLPTEAPPITLTFEAEFVDKICKGFEPYFIENDHTQLNELIRERKKPATKIQFTNNANKLAYECRMLYEHKYLITDSKDNVITWIMENFVWYDSKKNSYKPFILGYLRNHIKTNIGTPCKHPINIFTYPTEKK